jgi:hypothetical protein
MHSGRNNSSKTPVHVHHRLNEMAEEKGKERKENV